MAGGAARREYGLEAGAASADSGGGRTRPDFHRVGQDREAERRRVPRRGPQSPIMNHQSTNPQFPNSQSTIDNRQSTIDNRPIHNRPIHNRPIHNSRSPQSAIVNPQSLVAPTSPMPFA